MKRFGFFILFSLCLGASFVFAQEDTRLKSFQRIFTIGSIGTKIQALQDSESVTDEDMFPLYVQALEFILDNLSQLQNDAYARELSKIAARLISKKPDKNAAYYLYRLFEADKSTEVRIAALNGLGTAASGDSEIINKLNTWLVAQNDLHAGGGKPDRQVVAEMVVTLGKLGDPASFPILFSTGVAQYSSDINFKVNQALRQIRGDYREMLIDVIKKGPINDKLQALRTGLSRKLWDQKAGEIAEAALYVALELKTSNKETESLLRTMRYEAVAGIASLKWVKASPLLIEHFDRTNNEFKTAQLQKHICWML